MKLTTHRLTNAEVKNWWSVSSLPHILPWGVQGQLYFILLYTNKPVFVSSLHRLLIRGTFYMYRYTEIRIHTCVPKWVYKSPISDLVSEEEAILCTEGDAEMKWKRIFGAV